MDPYVYQSYVSILKHELVPALGCTEPIAIGYAAAKARSIIGRFPEYITVRCSGNIIKNVKSVIVPNSGGMRGIIAAATLGTVGGNADYAFEVFRQVTEADIAKTKELIKAGYCSCIYVEGKDNLFIRIEVKAGGETAAVEVEKEHSNITKIEKNGVPLLSSATRDDDNKYGSDKELLNIRDILDFANTVRIEDVRQLLTRQISMNSAIADEGLKNEYGVGVGRLLFHLKGTSVSGRATAKAAAGSDARMNGCSLPVVINSGSGNQGLTVTMPVCEYADGFEKTEEETLRALVIANLTAVHIKRYIGNLSAFCGATSAACGAACAIAYMDNCSYEQICMTLSNTLCNIGGMFCDGAKSSCAAKIASAVNAGIMGYEMAKCGKSFAAGEGLVGKNIEETIKNIGRVVDKGMRTTDNIILDIMTDNLKKI